MYTLRRTLIALFAFSLILLPAVPLGAGFAAADRSMRQDEPVTLYTFLAEPYTIDPQEASEEFEIILNEQLFLGLTNTHPVTGAIVPELATEWSVSEDGLVWTFTLRDDVPWVHWDPQTEGAEIIRTVTAHDVAYGMRRNCDPNVVGWYSSLVETILAGCTGLMLRPADQVTGEDYDMVQVYARDDITLEVHLQRPVGYFLNLTAMWNLRAVPREVIETHGADWTAVGHIVTNGPYMLTELASGGRIVLWNNPHLPGEVRGPGNIERIVATVTYDSALSREFDAHQLDFQPYRTLDQDGERAATDRQIEKFTMSVFYLGFTYGKPPFDNVHVRRAFAAAFDRSLLGESTSDGAIMPMIHFTPPGNFGAPPISEVGVGYDPDYAREQLALAGYPNCEGFPPITIQVFLDGDDYLDTLIAGAETVLGCDPALFVGEQTKFEHLIQNIIGPLELQPHVWSLAWAPDYPDAHNWVGDVLGCEAYARPCNEVDDLIDQAAVEMDPATRAALYHDIEQRFFGPAGEFPIIPMFMLIRFDAAKTWYDGPFETDGVFGGVHYDWYTIDQEVQLAARGAAD